MDRFTDMQTFVQIVEAGSISGAADRLGIAKSAVSRRLADLEQRLGIQLLHRSTRRLALTDTGRSFYERCLRILEDLEEAELAVSAEHGALTGRIRASVPLSFGLGPLVPAISDFLVRHPEVSFDLDFNDRQVDLLGEGFDLAIRIARLPDSTLIARRLAPVRHLVCASPAYWDTHGRPQSPHELASHAGLLYSLSAEPANWEYHAPDGRIGHVRLHGALSASNGDCLRELAVGGHGVTMQPTFIVHRAVASGALEPVLTAHTWFPLTAYAIYPHSRHLAGRVRAFVDFLIERFGERPQWDDCLQAIEPRAESGA